MGFGRTVKKKEIGRACSTYGGEKQYIGVCCVLGPEEKGLLGNVGGEWRILWKWT
jgi:hypothetical protein